MTKNTDLKKLSSKPSTAKNIGMFILTGFGILDASVAKKCDQGVFAFSFFAFWFAIIGSSLLRLYAFNETMLFLNAQSTYIWITLIAITLIGFSLDHSFFRSSLEQVARRLPRVSADKAKSMLPMFRGALLAPIMMRVSLIIPTMAVALVVLIVGSQGLIMNEIGDRQSIANLGLRQEIERALDIEQRALSRAVADAKQRLVITEENWVERNSIAKENLASLKKEVATLDADSEEVYEEISKLEVELRVKERLMYCEQYHSRQNPVLGCDNASGNPGIGENYKAAEYDSNVIRGQIEDKKALVAENDSRRKSILKKQGEIEFKDIDTTDEMERIRNAQESLAEFVQKRSDLAEERFQKSDDRVELDQSSLALQLSALSAIWSVSGAGVPLAIFGLMFAVFDLALAFMALAFPPNEYLTKLSEKMVSYQASLDRAVNEFIVDRAEYTKAGIRADLDVEVETMVKSSKFVSSEAKSRREHSSSQRQVESKLREEYLKQMSDAANMNDPMKRH